MKNLETIEKEKIIVILRGVEREKLIPLAEAMYLGGIRLVECTYDASGKIPDAETAENIRLLAEAFEGKMLIGAGTVLREEQVALTHSVGGKFIISPDTYAPVIAKTKELGLVSIPGALTPTEISTAHRLGADLVKVFPADQVGVKYIKDMKAPLSHIKLLAVGGVTADNIREYLAAGASGVGIGSGIVNKKAIAENDFEAITRYARLYTEKL